MGYDSPPQGILSAMSFPVSPEEEKYLWELSQNNLLVEEIESSLKVTCSVHFEQGKLYLLDSQTSEVVADTTITSNPKKDLLRVSYQWAMKIYLFRLDKNGFEGEA